MTETIPQTNLILTVGNVYIDHNVFGINNGDAPGLEWGKDYFGESGERVLGGSAINAALQALALGFEVGFVGKTGTDPGSKEVRMLLDKQGILADLVSEDANHKTSMAIDLVGRNGEFIGVHYGQASRNLSAADLDLDHPLFGRSSAVYFGGTAKQSQLFDQCHNVFSKLASRGVPVFYDPNRFPAHEESADRSLLLSQLAHVEGYFPNEDELLQATGKLSVDEALELMTGTGVKFIALKLGARGCRIKTPTEDFTVDGRKVDVLTTVGAGDCFNATFIVYYLKGKPLRECAERATIAAALKVSQNIWPSEMQIEEARHIWSLLL